MNREEHLSPKLLTVENMNSFTEENYCFSGDIQPLSGGVESAAWLLTSQRGKYVIKVFAPHEGPLERIQDEVNLYNFLIQHGVHAPVVIASRKEEKVSVLKTDTHSYPTFIMRFEQLRQTHPTSITFEELSTIIVSLARMHQILEKYPHKSQLTGKRPNSEQSKTDWSSFTTLINSVNKEMFSPQELAEVKETDEKMTYFLVKNHTPRIKKRAIIHGDLALEHAQFLLDGTVYFFDFADRSVGPIAYELATFLTHLFREEVISFNRWEELKEWSLKTYRSSNPLHQIDIDAISAFIIKRVHNEVSYLNNISAHIRCEVDSKGIKRRYKLAKYLLLKL